MSHPKVGKPEVTGALANLLLQAPLFYPTGDTDAEDAEIYQRTADWLTARGVVVAQPMSSSRGILLVEQLCRDVSFAAIQYSSLRTNAERDAANAALVERSKYAVLAYIGSLESR